VHGGLVLELERTRAIEQRRARVRFTGVRPAPCAGERFAQPFAGAATVASGIRVPAAVGDFMILDAVRASGGRAVAVAESRIRPWMEAASRATGLSICPETAACVGALESLAAEGWIKPDDRVVIFNTGAAQKYPEALAAQLPRIAKDEAIDWGRIEGARV
jgi:threonine synthase